MKFNEKACGRVIWRERTLDGPLQKRLLLVRRSNVETEDSRLRYRLVLLKRVRSIHASEMANLPVIGADCTSVGNSRRSVGSESFDAIRNCLLLQIPVGKLALLYVQNWAGSPGRQQVGERRTKISSTGPVPKRQDI